LDARPERRGEFRRAKVVYEGKESEKGQAPSRETAESPAIALVPTN